MAFIRRNILFVDDDPVAQSLIKSMLTQAGYVVTCVPDGFEALDILERHAFDLLILDIVMSKMSGFDLLKRLRFQPTTKDLPVMMLSSRDDRQIIARAIQLGAQDYLVKPPDRETMLKRIETLLGGQRSAPITQ